MPNELLNGAKTERTTSALSEETRKARRSLIAVTALWAAIVYLELVPSKISFLEIDLQEPKVSVAVLVAAVVVYLWVSFLIYGFRDWLNWYTEVVNGIWDPTNALKRRLETDKMAEVAIQKARAENQPPSHEITIKWPDSTHEQQITLEQLEKGLSYWQQEGRAMRRQRLISILDSSLRTAWEFLIPVGCGLYVSVWLAHYFWKS
jgi:hypothetical protein